MVLLTAKPTTQWVLVKIPYGPKTEVKQDPKTEERMSSENSTNISVKNSGLLNFYIVGKGTDIPHRSIHGINSPPADTRKSS